MLGLSDRVFKCNVLALLWLIVFSISTSSITIVGGTVMALMYSTLAFYYSFKDQKENKA